MSSITNLEDFRALDPFFRIIAAGLVGVADGSHFSDLLADDVVFDYIITVPDYPRHVVGRAATSSSIRGFAITLWLASERTLPEPTSRSVGLR